MATVREFQVTGIHDYKMTSQGRYSSLFYGNHADPCCLPQALSKELSSQWAKNKLFFIMSGQILDNNLFTQIGTAKEHLIRKNLKLNKI